MKQEGLERIIQYWEGALAGMQVGLNVDMPEILIRLPPSGQMIAFEIIKDIEANPQGWKLVYHFFFLIIAPMVEKFIADLRSLQGDES